MLRSVRKTMRRAAAYGSTGPCRWLERTNPEEQIQKRKGEKASVSPTPLLRPSYRKLV